MLKTEKLLNQSDTFRADARVAILPERDTDVGTILNFLHQKLVGLSIRRKNPMQLMDLREAQPTERFTGILPNQIIVNGKSVPKKYR